MIIGIAAVDNNWGIGKNNDLLFSLKEDMKHFREVTKNKIVVCGSNTLKSFPNSKPLKGRSTIVLCSKDKTYEDCICVHDLNELINIVKVLSITNDIYIIGGGQIYNYFFPYYDKVIITQVDTVDLEATVFFPDLTKDFVITNESETIIDNNYNIKFITYERRF